MNEVGLGERIGEMRRKAGFTQQQLCQKSGLSYSTLAKIERGAIKSPSVFTIQQVASALGISLDELVGAPAKPAQKTKQTSKSGAEFIFFDVNGCLVRFYHRAFAAVARDTGVSPDIVETTFWHYNDEVCRGELSMDEFNASLAKKFKTKSIDWMNYYLETVEPIPETADLIKWVHENYRVGLMTNIMPGFLGAMIAKGLIPDLNYEVIIDSSEVGAIKPEPAIYKEAQQKVGAGAGSILLVDDSRTNLMAAEKLGWHVLWFDDYRPKESTERIKKALEF